jgi:hypothetical protein
MPQIMVPEETFRRLSARATALNISVDKLVQPLLERLAESGTASLEPSAPLTGDARRAELEAWKRDAESRAERYPPGFVLDDSRETIYREREDAQLCPSDEPEFIDRLLEQDEAFRRLAEERRREADEGRVSTLADVRRRLGASSSDPPH